MPACEGLIHLRLHVKRAILTSFLLSSPVWEVRSTLPKVVRPTEMVIVRNGGIGRMYGPYWSIEDLVWFREHPHRAVTLCNVHTYFIGDKLTLLPYTDVIQF